jgi:hypothetical protein
VPAGVSVVSGDTRYLPTENDFSRFVVMIMKGAGGSVAGARNTGKESPAALQPLAGRGTRQVVCISPEIGEGLKVELTEGRG